jgi:hypothetical protein
LLSAAGVARLLQCHPTLIREARRPHPRPVHYAAALWF